MPLLNGSRPGEYLAASVLGGLMAVGGALVLLLSVENLGYGVALLLGGAVFGTVFGIEAKRRYARRSQDSAPSATAVTASSTSATIADPTAHSGGRPPRSDDIPEGAHVAFSENGGPVRRGVVRNGEIIFFD